MYKRVKFRLFIRHLFVYLHLEIATEYNGVAIFGILITLAQSKHPRR